MSGGKDSATGPDRPILARWESGSDAAPPPHLVALLGADETTTRALLVDGRGPRLAGEVDLARHPPMKDHSGRLAFGQKPIRLASFGALSPQDMKRAIFWATDGRSAETAKDARP